MLILITSCQGSPRNPYRYEKLKWPGDRALSVRFRLSQIAVPILIILSLSPPSDKPKIVVCNQCDPKFVPVPSRKTTLHHVLFRLFWMSTYLKHKFSQFSLTLLIHFRIIYIHKWILENRYKCKLPHVQNTRLSFFKKFSYEEPCLFLKFYHVLSDLIHPVYQPELQNLSK